MSEKLPYFLIFILILLSQKLTEADLNPEPLEYQSLETGGSYNESDTVGRSLEGSSLANDLQRLGKHIVHMLDNWKVKEKLRNLQERVVTDRSKNHIDEGRRRKQQPWTLMVPLLFGYHFSGMITVAVAIIKLFIVKAVLASKIAIIVASYFLAKKLFNTDKSEAEKNYKIVSPEPLRGGHLPKFTPYHAPPQPSYSVSQGVGDIDIESYIANHNKDVGQESPQNYHVGNVYSEPHSGGNSNSYTPEFHNIPDSTFHNAESASHGAELNSFKVSDASGYNGGESNAYHPGHVYDMNGFKPSNVESTGFNSGDSKGFSAGYSSGSTGGFVGSSGSNGPFRVGYSGASSTVVEQAPAILTQSYSIHEPSEQDHQPSNEQVNRVNFTFPEKSKLSSPINVVSTDRADSFTSRPLVSNRRKFQV
ncbi:hypothetical protein WDU94_002517 [Cyamophila willieti]